jgi:hypothetical protein
MEQGLLPPEGAAVSTVPAGRHEIDHRGWLMVIGMMVLIGLWSQRSRPLPSDPVRVPVVHCEAWMADALPGVGVKTRDVQWQRIKSGDLQALPKRARVVAEQIFMWEKGVVSKDR